FPYSEQHFPDPSSYTAQPQLIGQKSNHYGYGTGQAVFQGIGGRLQAPLGNLQNAFYKGSHDLQHFPQIAYKGLNRPEKGYGTIDHGHDSRGVEQGKQSGHHFGNDPLHNPFLDGIHHRIPKLGQSLLYPFPYSHQAPLLHIPKECPYAFHPIQHASNAGDPPGTDLRMFGQFLPYALHGNAQYLQDPADDPTQRKVLKHRHPSFPQLGHQPTHQTLYQMPPYIPEELNKSLFDGGHQVLQESHRIIPDQLEGFHGLGHNPRYEPNGELHELEQEFHHNADYADHKADQTPDRVRKTGYDPGK